MSQLKHLSRRANKTYLKATGKFPKGRRRKSVFEKNNPKHPGDYMYRKGTPSARKPREKK